MQPSEYWTTPWKNVDLVTCKKMCTFTVCSLWLSQAFYTFLKAFSPEHQLILKPCKMIPLKSLQSPKILLQYKNDHGGVSDNQNDGENDGVDEGYLN